MHWRYLSIVERCSRDDRPGVAVRESARLDLNRTIRLERLARGCERSVEIIQV